MDGSRVLLSIRTFLFVYCSAAVTVVVSERVFWFWTPGLLSHLEGALWYSLPMAAVIWAIAWFRVSTTWALLLVTPFHAYVTEGVLTPVMYSGGPFVPIFPAWFSAWHGLGAVFLLWFCVRAWLVEGRWKPIAVLGASLGVFWGVWASTLRLPEQVNDPELIADTGELVVLGPARFAMYAVLVTSILVTGHLALDRLWPAQFRVGRSSTRVLTGALLVLAAAWTIVVPWALPMFVAYGFVQVRVLRRHRTVSTGPNLIEQLDGRIDVRHLLGLLLIVPAASLTYLAIWRLDAGELVLRTVFYVVIAVQTVAGATVGVVAWRRGSRGPQAPVAAELTPDHRRFRTIGA